MRALLAAVALTACAAPMSVADPTKAGPHETITVDGMMAVAASGNTVSMHAVCPADESGAPWPVIVFGHGFQISPSAYEAYYQRLASHGFMVVAPDYPDPLMGPVNYFHDGQNLAGGLDWALTEDTLKTHVDISKAGVMGHSRGGKAAVLAALADPRFKAIYGVDPVDSPPPPSVTCDPQTECPSAYPLISKLSLPTLFVGETLDGDGAFACAPSAGNFAVFHANAKPPSLQVTVNGASHVSFVDDLTACGVTCELCQPATADHAAVIELSTAYAVAFFGRHLRGEKGYDSWLTGADAKEHFVTAGLASLESK
jgi:dienelactone hydrolase